MSAYLGQKVNIRPGVPNLRKSTQSPHRIWVRQDEVDHSRLEEIREELAV